MPAIFNRAGILLDEGVSRYLHLLILSVLSLDILVLTRALV